MITKKSASQIQSMVKGGKILARVKDALAAQVKEGRTGAKIDLLARELINKAGAEVSFEMEPDYHWATCIDINDGVVHGIPTDYPFKKGDVVGVDVGLRYEGFHTDTATTVAVGEIPSEKRRFLEIGRQTLNEAIKVAKAGRKVIDISMVIEKGLKEAGYAPVAALSGHGVGKSLHEDPLIPCVAVGDPKRSPVLEPGMTLAIEVIYTAGNGQVAYGGQLTASGSRGRPSDGWTIVSLDGTIAAVFEDTILITEAGPQILTRGQ